MAEETVTVPVPAEAEKMEESAAPSTSATPADGDDVDNEAKKLMGAGRRHMVMKDVRSAVNAFQEASSILGKKYGETSEQCADAFFSYGMALLELARMENGVLGNALEGMPEDEEEDGEKEEDPNIPSATNLDEKEREQLREQVYDAMAEKEEKSGKESSVEQAKIEGKEENGDVHIEEANEISEDKECSGAKANGEAPTAILENRDQAEKKETAEEEKKETTEAVNEDKTTDAVTEDQKETQAVTEGKEANDAVTEDQKQTLAVTEEKETTDAVTEDQKVTQAVTEGKETTEAVTENKMETDAVTEDQKETEAVSEEKVAVAEDPKETDAAIKEKESAEAVTEDKKETEAATKEKESTEDQEKTEAAPKTERTEAVTEDKETEAATEDQEMETEDVTEEKESTGAVTENISAESSKPEDKSAEEPKKEDAAEASKPEEQSVLESKSEEKVETEEKAEAPAEETASKEPPAAGDEKPGDEPMEGEEEGDDESEDGENDGTEEKENDEEEVGNLQLAWEMLDLSKIIFKRQGNKEAQLKAAQAHLKLGEVSVESENYSQAVEDFLACLNIQKEHLEAHDRLLAETHYHLGLAYQYSSRHEDAISHFTQSIEVIEKRMAVITEQVEKAAGESTEELQKEMDELKGLLPDIKEKIEDSKEAQKTSDATVKALKETLGGGSSGFTQENGSASTSVAPAEKSGDSTVPVTNCISDISHLVRKKRKPEESPQKEAKKCKAEPVENGSGNGDAVVPTNEEAEKAEEAEKQMETTAVESTA